MTIAGCAGIVNGVRSAAITRRARRSRRRTAMMMSDRVTATEGIRILLEWQQLHQRQEQLMTTLLTEYVERLKKILEDENAK